MIFFFFFTPSSLYLWCISYISSIPAGLQTDYTELCFHRKYLHTFRDRLRHGYSCVFSLLREDWGLMLLIPFISPLSVIQSSPGTRVTHTPEWARSTGDTDDTLKEFKAQRHSLQECDNWGRWEGRVPLVKGLWHSYDVIDGLAELVAL